MSFEQLKSETTRFRASSAQCNLQDICISVGNTFNWLIQALQMYQCTLCQKKELFHDLPVLSYDYSGLYHRLLRSQNLPCHRIDNHDTVTYVIVKVKRHKIIICDK